MVLTHCHDVRADGVAEREVASDGDEDIEGCCGADTSNDDNGGSEMRIVGDLVEDGEHLVKI